MPELKGSVKLGQYLKGLRLGYGYSLRKVEEKARRYGGEIDNSQLSRYEKGICYPSFDKLRTLANIFNVSIQTFSDVVDLEEVERTAPDEQDPQKLLVEGDRERKLGDYGRAYAHFQKARGLFEKVANGEDPSREESDAIARARLSSAIMLYRMGKISLCEYEIRQMLRMERQIDQGLVVRALVQLSSVHASFGDFMLAQLEAERSLEIARSSDDRQLEAYALHSLGRIHQEREEFDAAIESYHEALTLYRELENDHEALKVKLNLGPIYAARGQLNEGVRLLTDTREEARKLGYRWTVASACAWLAEVYFKNEKFDMARQYMRESNAIASSGKEQYLDILFLNAYYLWQVARAEGSAAEAKIALGRMKYLRPHLELDLPEVRNFDKHMENGGAR